MSAVISARKLTKRYKGTVAVDAIDFDIPAGRIVGLIGPNGSGKTTTLKAALGLVPFEGELKVLGKDPRTQRDELMQDVCFIADVAVLADGHAAGDRRDEGEHGRDPGHDDRCPQEAAAVFPELALYQPFERVRVHA